MAGSARSALLVSLVQLLRGRQRGGVPAAAEGLDEERAGGHPAAEDVRGGPAVRQHDGLRDDDVQGAGGALLVLVDGERGRIYRGLHRLVLGERLFLEDPERGEVVLHVLEGGEDGLAIGRDGGVIDGAGLVGKGAPESGVEDRLRGGGSDGPETARPDEPVRQVANLRSRRRR